MKPGLWPVVAIAGIAGGLALGMAFGVAGSRPGGVFSDRPAPAGTSLSTGSRPRTAGEASHIRPASAVPAEGDIAEPPRAAFPAPVRYDGTPRSLNALLKEAGVPPWTRWRLVQVETYEKSVPYMGLEDRKKRDEVSACIRRGHRKRSGRCGRIR